MHIEEMHADVEKYSSINRDSRALEVGIGTGQATLPFLEINCHVIAIELGSELAAFSKKSLKATKILKL